MEELEAGDKGYNPVPPEEVKDHILIYMGLFHNGAAEAHGYWDVFRLCMIFKLV